MPADTSSIDTSLEQILEEARAAAIEMSGIRQAIYRAIATAAEQRTLMRIETVVIAQGSNTTKIGAEMVANLKADAGVLADAAPRAALAALDKLPFWVDQWEAPTTDHITSAAIASETDTQTSLPMGIVAAIGSVDDEADRLLRDNYYEPLETNVPVELPAEAIRAWTQYAHLVPPALERWKKIVELRAERDALVAADIWESA